MWIRIPTPPPGAGSNLLGLAGLLALVAAIGGLTGNVWWSVLVAGLFAVALAYTAQTASHPRKPAARDEIPHLTPATGRAR